MEITTLVDKQIEFTKGKCYIALNLYDFLLLSEEAYLSIIEKNYENVTIEELDDRTRTFLNDVFYCLHDLSYDLINNYNLSKNFDIILGYMIPGDVNDFRQEPLVIDGIILSKFRLATIDFSFKSYKNISTREIKQRRLYKRILRRHNMTGPMTIKSYFCFPKEDDDFEEDDFKLTSCSLTKLTESLLHFFRDQEEPVESLQEFIYSDFTERGN